MDIWHNLNSCGRPTFYFLPPDGADRERPAFVVEIRRTHLLARESYAQTSARSLKNWGYRPIPKESVPNLLKSWDSKEINLGGGTVKYKNTLLATILELAETEGGICDSE